MQEDVTINIQIPKELIPVLTSFVESLRKAVTGDDAAPTVVSTSNGYTSSISITGNTTVGKPSKEEVVDFCRKRKSSVDGNRFYDWAEKHNWKDAKGNQITDWKAQIVKWESYRLEKTSVINTTTSTRDMLDSSYAMMLEWGRE